MTRALGPEEDKGVDAVACPLGAGSSGTPSFSTLLLVGGASRRMGRDKALLTVPETNRPLWQRQWRVLEDLRPQEFFWSGAREYRPANSRLVTDAIPGAGPLSGISACLDVLQSDLLVVLAVDLPRMTPAFLRSLLQCCASEIGTVAQLGGFYEPLAAVYPRRLNDLAKRHLARKRYTMQDFIREGVTAKALRSILVKQSDECLFQNLNAPSDVVQWEAATLLKSSQK